MCVNLVLEELGKWELSFVVDGVEFGAFAYFFELGFYLFVDFIMCLKNKRKEDEEKSSGV